MTLSEAWGVFSISKIFVAGCKNKDAFSKHSLFNHQCLKPRSDSFPRCLALVHLFWIWVKWKGYVSANWTDIFQKVLSSNLLYLVEFHDHVLVQAAIGFKHIFAMINLEVMNFHNMALPFSLIAKLFLVIQCLNIECLVSILLTCWQKNEFHDN